MLNPTLKTQSRGWLKYRSDRRSVFFVLFTFALQILALRLNWGLLSIPARVAMSGSLAFFCSVCFVINHNHIHIPFFKRDGANRVFSVVISIAEGLSSRFLVVPHNLNHHVYGGKKGDWCHEENAGDGPGVYRMLRYIAVTWAVMFRDTGKPGAPRLPARLKQQEWLEHGAIFVFTVIALVVNPLAFALAILPAWLAASGFITLTNLVQHEECDTDSEFGNYRNYVGALGNFLLFNAGFHTAHHVRPALHWSELPKLHAEIADRIPARLNEPSLLFYLLRQLVKAGKPVAASPELKPASVT